MHDPAFIKRMLEKGYSAKVKADSEFSGMTLQQLNWKPAPERWSIAQCLDHLIVSDTSYFPVLTKITERSYGMTAWERWSPFSGIFGKLLVDHLQEEVRRKMKAPGVFRPAESDLDATILERFQTCLDILLGYIGACGKIDIDKVIITSPANKFVTYSLRDAITILMQHQHRHINQGIKVKKNL